MCPPGPTGRDLSFGCLRGAGGTHAHGVVAIRVSSAVPRIRSTRVRVVHRFRPRRCPTVGRHVHALGPSDHRGRADPDRCRPPDGSEHADPASGSHPPQSPVVDQYPPERPVSAFSVLVPRRPGRAESEPPALYRISARSSFAQALEIGGREIDAGRADSRCRDLATLDRTRARARPPKAETSLSQRAEVQPVLHPVGPEASDSAAEPVQSILRRPLDRNSCPTPHSWPRLTPDRRV